MSSTNMYAILMNSGEATVSSPPASTKSAPKPKAAPTRKAKPWIKKCKLSDEQVKLLFRKSVDNDPNGRRPMSALQWFQAEAEPACGSEYAKVTFNVTGKKGDADRRLVVRCMAKSKADKDRVNRFFEAICKVACGNAVTRSASKARTARASVLKQFLQSTEEKPHLARAKFALFVQKKGNKTWLEEKDGDRVMVRIRLREVTDDEQNGTATHVLEFFSESDKAAKAARKWFYALVKNPNAREYVERTSTTGSVASSAAATPRPQRRKQQRKKAKAQPKPDLASADAFPTLDGSAPTEAATPVWDGPVNSAAEKAAKLEAEEKAALTAAALLKAKAEEEAKATAKAEAEAKAMAIAAARAKAAVQAGKDAKAAREAAIASAKAEAEAQIKLEQGRGKMTLQQLKRRNAMKRRNGRKQKLGIQELPLGK